MDKSSDLRPMIQYIFLNSITFFPNGLLPLKYNIQIHAKIFCVMCNDFIVNYDGIF